METTPQTNASSASHPSEDNTGALVKAASAAHGAVDRISSAAEQAACNAKPAIERAAKAAHQGIDKAAAAAPTTESLKAIHKTLVDATRRYVAAKPLTAVGIAVVFGILLAHIL